MVPPAPGVVSVLVPADCSSDQLQNNPDLGKAEALQLSMLSMLRSDYTHPAFWAPFVVVGEGGIPVATQP